MEGDVESLTHKEFDPVDLDQITQKLLESDEDECKVLERYDIGDPNFMEKAYADMQKLDSLLQGRFQDESRLRRKRKRHLKNIRQTLSEFKMGELSRPECRQELANTRKLFSSTTSKFHDRPIETTAERPDQANQDATEQLSVSGAQSCGSSLSRPKRITSEELLEVEKNWALMATESADDLYTFLESDPEENDPQNETKHEAKTKPPFTFRFDTTPNKIDHVKRNILRAGQYYTPEEKQRLADLMKEETADEGQALISAGTANPFTIFGEEMRALQSIDQLLQTVASQPTGITEGSDDTEPSTFGRGVEQLRFGFYKNSNDENYAACKRFQEITDRIKVIENQENLMLDRILAGGGELDSLAEEINIASALEAAKNDLDSDKASQNRAVVPFVSEKELQLLLGPCPKISHFDEKFGQKETGKSFELWKVWLAEREKAFNALNYEMRKDRESLLKELQNDDMTMIEATEQKFKELMEDLQKIKSQVDALISLNGEENSEINKDNLLPATCVDAATMPMTVVH